ncbi:MAG: pyruvate, phosphate dikinase [Candidatus Margulisbacteria bacterium]|nr:pyruvate, phosphate dikinase [Candidatus Margulisiibacteriota bacterium]
MAKNIYFFGSGKGEADASMRNLLGGKGANLAEMTNLGVPVPAGFTISTEMCLDYYKNGRKLSDELLAEIKENIVKTEKAMGMKFNDAENPLLFSVRSGARVSMPGMMDTVLNLGLNDTTIKGLVAKSGNERFAYDSYRRFINMYGDVVMDVHHEYFEEKITAMKKARGVENDTDLSAADLKELVEQYKVVVKEHAGKAFPDDGFEQLKMAVAAVFSSWEVPRAVKYRKMNNIDDSWGTAVNVQAMVFGNMGETSGTGVAFTRNPSTGENLFYGEFLMNAQGEDVVAGIRTPQEISELEKIMPVCYKQLVDIYKKLEKHYKDMQDMEFTIQEGVLYMLQTRSGKRTAAAAVRCAVEMFKEGLIDKETALNRVAPTQLDMLLHPNISPNAKLTVIAKGLPASPGAAVGKCSFTAEDAEERKAKGEQVILVRQETSPEDIGGMDAAEGILTARGGMTSHAAVVARGMGKPCVAGCAAIDINEKAQTVTIAGKKYGPNDFITLNGTTGEVVAGKVELTTPTLSGDFGVLMGWTDEFRTLNIRTNADTPHDAKVARDFGAEGIGLCRTEHMFFEGDRIKAVREMILSEDLEGRKAALAKLLPIQKGDFKGIFEVMDGLAVTIRLLDPPLHEFVPHTPEAQADMAKEMGISAEAVKIRVDQLHEFNPMLGHRGCRLGITYPEIYDMQVEAIITAAVEVAKAGKKVIPEIMIPLVGMLPEFKILKANAVKIADEIISKANIKLDYKVGTMIEIPRATLIADQIAEHAEFFSFGTNDLTQMTLGFSRDDAGVFLPEYVERQILPDDPFQSIDQEGVGMLVQYGVERGRKTNPTLKIGVCGEHGGDPKSIEFFHNAGLSYVSCSPFRVPIARLAAAQAAIKSKKKLK